MSNLNFLFGVVSQQVSYFFIVNFQVGCPHKELGVFGTLFDTEDDSMDSVSELFTYIHVK